MKKACVYIPLFILFLDSTSLNQLFKVPVLISHFIEHRTLDNKVGLVEFLSMHYWGTDLNDNDQDRDMQLPFKKADECACFHIAIPIAKITVEKQQFHTLKIFHTFSKDDHLSNPALTSLFRPPRS